MTPVLPNFFMVGAAKAGTTSLANYLAQHPDVFIPEVKEPKFLSFEENTFPHKGPGDEEVDAKVVRTLQEYQELFAPGASAAARGDASVDSLLFPGVVQRIRDMAPEGRIIMVLRNPTARAFSAYMHLVRDGRETLSFEEALAAEEERRNANWEFIWHYARCGLYHDQIKAYLDVFPREQVLVLLFEDFKEAPARTCRTIFRFLGVDAGFEPDVGVRHNISGKPRSRSLHTLLYSENFFKTIVKRLMPEGLRARIRRSIDSTNLERNSLDETTRNTLAAFFEEDGKKLEQLLDVDLSKWRAPSE